MAILLIDTDVYSYLTSSNPDRASPYKKHLDGHTITLSFITVGEQYAGYLKQIKKGAWPEVRLWIAACAKRHSLSLITNNRKNFEGIPGLTVISEAPEKQNS
jgi:predicted nucleic acid-binding protein